MAVRCENKKALNDLETSQSPTSSTYLFGHDPKHLCARIQVPIGGSAALPAYKRRFPKSSACVDVGVTIFSMESERVMGSVGERSSFLIGFSRYESPLPDGWERLRRRAKRGRIDGRQALTMAMLISTVDQVAAPKSVSKEAA